MISHCPRQFWSTKSFSFLSVAWPKSLLHTYETWRLAITD
jgi:hypothetical protein